MRPDPGGLPSAFGVVPLWWTITVLSAAGLRVRALTWPWPPEPAWLTVTWTAAFAAVAIWATVRRNRSERYRARAALIAAARPRAGACWLNRAGDLEFLVSPERLLGLRMWVIVRMDQDIRRELAELGAGELPAIFEQFYVLPFTAAVIRSDDAWLVDAETTTARALPGTPGPFTTTRRRLQMAPAGLGITVPDPAEIRELAGQLTAAEPNPG